MEHAHFGFHLLYINISYALKRVSLEPDGQSLDLVTLDIVVVGMRSKNISVKLLVLLNVLDNNIPYRGRVECGRLDC